MNNLKDFLKNLLTLTLTLFFVLGLIIVFVQFAAVLMNNGSLSISISDYIKDIAVKLSIATAFLSLAITTIKDKDKN